MYQKIYLLTKKFFKNILSNFPVFPVQAVFYFWGFNFTLDQSKPLTDLRYNSMIVLKVFQEYISGLDDPLLLQSVQFSVVLL
jgi:hypothetical protein